MSRIFKDKKGRNIAISCDGDAIAKHKGKRIGSIAISINDDGENCLYSMDVSNDYQRAGIATELMKEVVAHWGDDFSIPSSTAIGGKNAPCESYLSSEGAAFIASCRDQKILPPEKDYIDM